MSLVPADGAFREVEVSALTLFPDDVVAEEWRDVPAHPLLQASSWGRVRSKPYEVPMPGGGKRVTQLAPTFGVVANGNGRDSSHVRMQITFRRKTYKVHRLVALAFHGEPPEGKPYVLHQDEDATNNLPENLKWGDQKENLNAPGFLEYCRQRRRGGRAPKQLSLLQDNEDGSKERAAQAL